MVSRLVVSIFEISSQKGLNKNWLVVLTILKNMKVNGKDDIPYMKWKIKAMFETTNQIMMAKIQITFLGIL